MGAFALGVMCIGCGEWACWDTLAAGRKGKVLHESVRERVRLVVEGGGEMPVLCIRYKLCGWRPLIRNAETARHGREGCARVDEVVLIVVLRLYCEA